MVAAEHEGIGPLKIVVCIKQVPQLSALRFDPETRRLVREGVLLEVNELDIYALSEAIRLRTVYGGEVIAITMGPPQAHEALATALAMGADRAIHLSDRAFGGADTAATARTLVLAISRVVDGSKQKRDQFLIMPMGIDLIFCGRHSIDAETSQVGPEIAEMLNLPQISAVQKIELQLSHGRREVLATRETDEGSETLTVPLPALITAAERLNEGIWPDLDAIREASEQHDRYQVITAADLNVDLDLLGQKGSPTWVATVENDIHERAGRIIPGDDPAKAVEELVNDLQERGLLRSTSDAGAPLTEHPGSHLHTLHGANLLRQGDLLPGKAVWVVAELATHGIRRVTLELLGKGIELAAALSGELAAVLIGGPEVAQYAPILTAYGAERVYVAADPVLEQYTTDGYTAVLAQAILHHQPAVVLLGSTADGRDLAPRVAARLNLGLTGDCIDLTIDEQERLVQFKPAFGNTIISSILSHTLPALATLRPGMLHAAIPDFSRIPLIERLPTDGIANLIRTKIISRVHYDRGAAELESAETVIGVGMGMGAPEHYEPVFRLAKLLNAAVGASRNVADSGWFHKQVQIGLTGRAIAPHLYIALGIRGAAEHIAGIRKAGYIVCINKNKRAAIFRQADVGIIGDVHVLLPLLIEEVGRRRV